MALQFRSPVVPQAADWEWHKETLKHLYLVEGKPLREVSAIMLANHNFKATEKMYKHRFQLWGFRKNLSAEERRLFEAQAVAGWRIHLPSAHGRQLGSKRLKARVLFAQQLHHTLLQLPRAVDPPTHFSLTEVSIQAAMTYVKAQLGGWNATYHPVGVPDTILWQDKICLAAHQISQRKGLASNFRILNSACDEYKTILRTEDPALIFVTYNSILRLFEAGDELARPCIKLIAGYCSIYLGNKHPLSVLWTNVSRMDASETRNLALPIMTAQSDLFRQGLEPGNPILPYYYTKVAKSFHELGLLSPKETQSSLDTCAQWIWQNRNLADDGMLTTVQLLEIYVLKATIHGDHEQWEETKAALDAGDSLINDREGNSMSLPRIRLEQVNLFGLRAEMLNQIGKHESAKYYFGKALSIGRKLQENIMPKTADMADVVEEQYLYHEGDIERARTLRQDNPLELQLAYNQFLKAVNSTDIEH